MKNGPVRASAALLLGLLACGCSDDDASRESNECDAKRATPALEVTEHVDCNLPVSYASNPPSSGTHYSFWPMWGVYRVALPRGYTVHALEHGAVVISYSCSGCDADVEAAERLVSELVDPDCSASGVTRVILTPDPLLDVPWAAAAWGHTLRAQCFDARAFKSFFDDRVGNGPEQVCAPGSVLLLPDGSFELPPGCGSAP